MVKKIKNVCVFMGASPAIGTGHAGQVSDCARGLALNDYNVVYGGGDYKEMGRFARMFMRFSHRKHIKGVNTKIFAESLNPLSDHIAEELMSSKLSRAQRMLELSDAVLILPGGGDLMMEAHAALSYQEEVEIKYPQKQRPPVIFVNNDGFFGDMLAQIMQAVDQERTPMKIFDDVFVVEDVRDAVEVLNSVNRYDRDLAYHEYGADRLFIPEKQGVLHSSHVDVNVYRR